MQFDATFFALVALIIFLAIAVDFATPARWLGANRCHHRACSFFPLASRDQNLPGRCVVTHVFGHFALAPAHGALHSRRLIPCCIEYSEILKGVGFTESHVI